VREKKARPPARLPALAARAAAILPSSPSPRIALYNLHALKFTPGIAAATLPPRGVASFHYAFLTIVVTPRRPPLRGAVARPRRVE